MKEDSHEAIAYPIKLPAGLICALVVNLNDDMYEDLQKLTQEMITRYNSKEHARMIIAAGQDIQDGFRLRKLLGEK